MSKMHNFDIDDEFYFGPNDSDEDDEETDAKNTPEVKQEQEQVKGLGART